MTVPRVTICVPTYNKAEFLGKSLRSILGQTWSDFALIVVDDHSTDATREVVRALADPRIRYVVNKENLGLTANWNRCLELALAEESPYVAIYHDDDLYTPTILEREVNFLERHPRVGLVHTALFYYQEDAGRYTLRMPYKRDRISSHDELLDDLRLTGTYFISTPGVLARRDAYVKAGTFDTSFKICPDLDLWWRMIEHYDIGYIAAPLFVQRIHRKQMSSSRQALRQSINQGEIRRVIEGAIRSLQQRRPDVSIDVYRRCVARYCAKEILRCASVALLDGQAEAVDEACREALRLSPTAKVCLASLVLRALNNRGGRWAAGMARKAVRHLRKRRLPMPVEVG